MAGLRLFGMDHCFGSSLCTHWPCGSAKWQQWILPALTGRTGKWSVLVRHGQRSSIKKNKVKVFVTQSCPTLCDPIDYSPPVSSTSGFSSQEYWRELPFPTPGDLPTPEINPTSSALQADSLLSEPSGTHSPSRELYYYLAVQRVFTWGPFWRNENGLDQGMTKMVEWPALYPSGLETVMLLDPKSDSSDLQILYTATPGPPRTVRKADRKQKVRTVKKGIRKAEVNKQGFYSLTCHKQWT